MMKHPKMGGWRLLGCLLAITTTLAVAAPAAQAADGLDKKAVPANPGETKPTLPPVVVTPGGAAANNVVMTTTAGVTCSTGGCSVQGCSTQGCCQKSRRACRPRRCRRCCN